MKAATDDIVYTDQDQSYLKINKTDSNQHSAKESKERDFGPIHDHQVTFGSIHGSALRGDNSREYTSISEGS